MSSVASLAALHRPVRRSAAVIGIAGILLVVAVIGSLAVGPVLLAPQDVMRILLDASSGVRPTEGIAMRDAVVVLDIRLPRTVLTLLVGASLATAGAVLQGDSAIRSPTPVWSAFQPVRPSPRFCGSCSAA